MGAGLRVVGDGARALHLVDLENLIGDPRARGSIVTDAFDRYRALAAWQPGDHTVLAANPALVRELAWQLGPDVAVRAARGKDGADLHLLASAPPEWVVKRFGRLVIGSGDHIFATRARAVQEEGVFVAVVSRRSALSGALRDERFAIRFFDPVVEERAA